MSHQRTKQWLVLVLTLTLILPSYPIYSEEEPPQNPNPFGDFNGNNGENNNNNNNNEITENEDEFDSLDDDFGFQPPPDLLPPKGNAKKLPEPGSPSPRLTPPKPKRDAKPSFRKTTPKPRTTPRRTTRPTPTPSRSSSKPPPTLAAPPKTTTPPKTSVPLATSKTKPNTSELAGYLQLDPAVRGLQVKNFDLQEQDIRNVVKLISKWTGKNFILDQKVRGKITILGPSQVTLQEAYQAFLSALAANGMTTVQSGKFIRIIESAEARRAPVKTYIGDYAPNTDQFITRIFQLKYINADEVQREFRDMTTRQGKLFAYEPTNSVIITDTGSNIQRIKEILDSLDIPAYEATLHVIPIKHNSSKKISDLLAEIYSSGGSTGTRRSGSNRRTFRRSQLERTRGGGVITKIVPDEQTNTLVVLANDRGFGQLKSLVAKLDTRASDTGKVHVYYCEYAKAEDLAATLAALSGSGTGSSRSSARSSRNRNRSSRNRNNRNSRSRNTSSRSGPISADLDGGVRITSDSSTNALVITANAGDYQALKRVIKKLDIPRLQVFVESAIMELSLDDNTNIGLNYAFGHPDRLFGGGFIGDSATLTNLLIGGTPSEGATIPFFNGTQFYGVPFNFGGSSGTTVTQGFMSVLNLLTSTTKASVLSTPQIIALDNEEAQFRVQDEIPVQGSTTNTATASTASIERLKAGIDIKLTPYINAASGTIRLDIEQTVDSLKSANDVPSALQSTQRAKTTRETNTSVVVKDEDYVVLGGLMTDQIDEVAKKVPLLGDIPVLGWLFKSKSYNKVKKNLIVLLKPKIIGTTLASANLVQDKLDERAYFVDKYYDGDEVYEEAVSEYQRGIDEQKKRGKTSKIYNYRNNNPDVPLDAQRDVQSEQKRQQKRAPKRRPQQPPADLDKDMEQLLGEAEREPQSTIHAEKPRSRQPQPPENGDFVTSPPNDPFSMAEPTNTPGPPSEIEMEDGADDDAVDL